jgi:hypothetical protein
MPAFSTRIHAYLHYILAIFLLAAPFWGRFAGPNAETWVAVGVGVAIVTYGLITDNELGIFRRLQMPLHLWIDAFAGVVVATSPWVDPTRRRRRAASGAGDRKPYHSRI